MPTPSSGQISFADIATIVYNSSTSQISLNDGDVRLLLGVGSGQVPINPNAYNKPASGNTGSTYYVPGNYSWVVVPYQNLTVTIAGGGGGGGGYCGGQVYFGCVNYCSSGAGNAGANSTFNGVTAFGGGGGQPCSGGVGSNGRNSLNANTGGGGTKGLGNTNPWDTNCNQAAGSNGGAGGYALKTWRKSVDGPNFGTTISFRVGAGGSGVGGGCRPLPGGPGGNGYVYIAWS